MIKVLFKSEELLIAAGAVVYGNTTKNTVPQQSYSKEW